VDGCLQDIIFLLMQACEWGFDQTLAKGFAHTQKIVYMLAKEHKRQ